MRPAVRLLLIVIYPWIAAAALLLIHAHGEPADTCTTDTECMDMHGGDGGPETLTTT